MKTFFAICLALGAGCFLCGQSRAQFAAGELPAFGNASTNDTVILSDQGLEAHLKEKTYIYRENVRVFNPQMTITSALLTIEVPDVDNGKYNHVVAETNVVISWLDEHGTNHATADRVEYTYALTNLAKLPEKQYHTNSTVLLVGHAHLDLGSQKVDGDPILWDRITDIVSTTNMQKTTITSTNMFDMGTSAKTNSHAK